MSIRVGSNRIGDEVAFVTVSETPCACLRILDVTTRVELDDTIPN